MAVTAPAELAAAATIINFWDTTTNAAVWYSVFIVVVAVLNFSGVRWYGEVRRLWIELCREKLLIYRISPKLCLPL